MDVAKVSVERGVFSYTPIYTALTIAIVPSQVLPPIVID
jgi:hypothetical protein